MKRKRTEYTITKWKIDGTMYTFTNAKEMLVKHAEMKKLLKSNEKLEIVRTEITENEYIAPLTNH